MNDYPMFPSIDAMVLDNSHLLFPNTPFVDYINEVTGFHGGRRVVTNVRWARPECFWWARMNHKKCDSNDDIDGYVHRRVLSLFVYIEISFL